MTTMHPILARFHNEPALVTPDNHSLFASLLSAVAGSDLDGLTEAAAAQDGFWPSEDSFLARYRPYVVRDGVLHIPVKGVLLHEFPYALGDWATGYDYIWRAFQRGCEDFAVGNIKGIALVVDSPGGMVAGCFDAADKMVAAKTAAGVPVRSYAAESAYSAAYAMAVVGDTITVSRTGGVGSIGVVTMHLDVSGAMEQAGFKVTFIHAGKHKVDGNAYEALPDDVKARIQSRIDELYGIFTAHVAANRPLDDAAVRATEALCFTASEAKSNGLADAIGALDDALAQFAADLSNPPEGDEDMSTQDNSAENTAAENTVDVAQVAADAVAADRQRRRDIMGSDEAKDRPALAAHLADATDMTVDQAKAVLGAAAKETAPAAKTDAATPFADAMNNQEQPNVGAEAGNTAENDDEDSADDVLALVRGLGIKGFKAAASA